MSWLDSAIAFLSPKRAAERMAWRNAYDEMQGLGGAGRPEWMRNYDAGAGGRLNANWRAGNYSAEETDASSRDWVRARARDLERNSDMLNAVLWAQKRNVVGAGFQLQAKTGDPERNKALEALWREWCKARNCDVTGHQSLNQMLRMAVVRKKVDGGILFVKRYTRDGIVPLSVQMVEVDELDSMQPAPRRQGDRVVGGIEYNRYNRPVGYWIRQYCADGLTAADSAWVKADDVIFYYTKRRPSQVREMSDMAQTLTRIRDVNEYMTAVSVKQRVEACLSVFVKKQYPVSGIGRQAAAGQDGRYSYDGKTLTPGMIHEMNQGDDIEVVNPSGQSADATQFVKLQQRLIGAGQGLSYEATSRDMSETNYSSARQGAIEDELTYLEEREEVVAILDELYESFVISAALSGALDAPDFWEDKAAWLAHDWVQPPKKWIDPQKESGALKTALNTGVKTYKQVAAENGADWRTQIDDMAEVLDYARERGLDLEKVIFAGGGEKAAPQEGGEDGEETGGDGPGRA